MSARRGRSSKLHIGIAGSDAGLDRLICPETSTMTETRCLDDSRANPGPQIGDDAPGSPVPQAPSGERSGVMSGEVWAIIGVTVGAFIPGGIGLAQAILQRRWSVKDAGRAWEQEKRDRLWEAKRDAYTTFTQALYKAQAMMLNGMRPDEPSLGDHPGWAGLTESLLHQHAQLHIYATPEGSESAGNAIGVLMDIAGAGDSEADGERLRRAYFRARSLYLNTARIDMGVQHHRVSPDSFKKLLKETRHPDEETSPHPDVD